MSNPSFSNIDRWLFELKEGNLSPEQEQQLEIFLLNHPEFDLEKDAWDLAHVKKEEVQFPNQAKFYRRRPLGLYMAAGFTSISIFVAIGINVATQDDFGTGSVQSAKNSVMNNTDPSSSSPSPNNTSSSASDFSTELREDAQNNLEAESSEASINEISRLGIVRNVFDLEFLNLSSVSASINEFHSSSSSARIHNSVETLKLRNAKEVNVLSNQQKSQGHGETSASTSAKKSVSTFTKWMRKFRKMVDQPIALKNMRDANFMVPGISSMDANFSATGSLPVTRIQSMTRYQWAQNANEQWINQLAFDSYIYGLRGGIAVQANNGYYHRGQIMNTNVALTYSPKIALSKNILLEPAMRFKMGTKSLNAGKIDGIGAAEFDRQNVNEFYPSGVQPNGKQLWYRDLGLSVMLNTKWFYVGIQGDNLLRHYDNIYSGANAAERRAGYHFTATLGTDYLSQKGSFALSPYLFYQQIEQLKEAWLGVNTRIGWFTAGASMSNHLDAVASVGLKFKRFAFSCQADYTQSHLLNKKLLSYQVNLKVITLNPNRKQKLINF